MTCSHLRQLYHLCQEHNVRLELGSSDIVRIVCHECGIQDVCPSVLTDEYDATHVEAVDAQEDGGQEDGAE